MLVLRGAEANFSMQSTICHPVTVRQADLIINLTNSMMTDFLFQLNSTILTMFTRGDIKVCTGTYNFGVHVVDNYYLNMCNYYLLPLTIMRWIRPAMPITLVNELQPIMNN